MLEELAGQEYQSQQDSQDVGGFIDYVREEDDGIMSGLMGGDLEY